MSRKRLPAPYRSVLAPLTGRPAPGTRLRSGGIQCRTAVPPCRPEPNSRGSHEALDPLRGRPPRCRSSLPRGQGEPDLQRLVRGGPRPHGRSRRLDDVRQSIHASAAHGRRRPRWRPWGPARLHRVQRRRTQLPCHGLSGRQGRRAPGPAVQADVLGEGRKPQGRRSRRRPGQHPRLGGLRAWETFTPGPRWERFEFLFQCQHDVPAATSRLQVWFKSTGTLWLDDVTLAETSDKPQWYPRIGTEGVTNAIPNSSFQCGTIGWGSLTFAWAAGRGTCSDSRVSTRRATQD